MEIISKFRVSGWLPAGLLINGRHMTAAEQAEWGDAAIGYPRPNYTQIDASNPDTEQLVINVNRTRLLKLPQTTAEIALALSGEFLTPLLAVRADINSRDYGASSLMSGFDLQVTPFVTACAVMFVGEVKLIRGADVPAAFLPLDNNDSDYAIWVNRGIGNRVMLPEGNDLFDMVATELVDSYGLSIYLSAHDEAAGSNIRFIEASQAVLPATAFAGSGSPSVEEVSNPLGTYLVVGMSEGVQVQKVHFVYLEGAVVARCHNGAVATSTIDWSECGQDLLLEGDISRGTDTVLLTAPEQPNLGHIAVSAFSVDTE